VRYLGVIVSLFSWSFTEVFLRTRYLPCVSRSPPDYEIEVSPPCGSDIDVSFFALCQSLSTDILFLVTGLFPFHIPDSDWLAVLEMILVVFFAESPSVSKPLRGVSSLDRLGLSGRPVLSRTRVISCTFSRSCFCSLRSACFSFLPPPPPPAAS